MAIAEKQIIEFLGKDLKPFLKKKTLHQVYSFIFITYNRTTVMKMNYMRRGILQPSLSLLVDSLLVDVESSILYTVGYPAGRCYDTISLKSCSEDSRFFFSEGYEIKLCFITFFFFFSDITPLEFFCNSRWHVLLLNPLPLTIGV